MRFTTSHPKDLSPRLIAAIAALPRVCEHVHLPLQAGDDEVLRRMGRGYTLAHYEGLVGQLRAAVPGVALTTDVMVGFPGETEEQFQRTLAAFGRLRYDQAFMFKYNDRPGTRAAELPGKVPEQEKQHRLERLVALQDRIALETNETQRGRAMDVLVEGADPKTPGKMRGRTRHNKLVIFAADESAAGRLVAVRATAARRWGWLGELASAPEG